MSTQRTPRGPGGGGVAPPGGGPPHERDLGRRRAKRAWAWVEEAKKKKQGEGYANLAKKLPSMLQGSGLGQTLAYLYGKGFEKGKPKQNAEGVLLVQLSDYVKELQKRAHEDPMDVLLSLDAAEYRSATREMMKITEWLKRFAEGQLA